MTQRVLICNFQYYIVYGVDRVEGDNESIVTLRVLWAPLKKKVTDFLIESAVLSMRNLPIFYFLVFWLLMGFHFVIVDCFDISWHEIAHGLIEVRICFAFFEHFDDVAYHI